MENPTITPSIKAIDELVAQLAEAQERARTIKAQLNEARRQIREALRGTPKRKARKPRNTTEKAEKVTRRRGLPKAAAAPDAEG